MNNLNNVIIEGNCVREADVTITAKGTAVCTFALASHRYYKVGDAFEEEVSFFEVESWGKLAERVSRNCQKGRGVRIVGRLRQNRWEDSEGKKKSRVRIIAEHIDFRPVSVKTELPPAEAQSPQGEVSQNEDFADFPLDGDIVF